MTQFLKAARVVKSEITEETLSKINQFTLRPMTADEVFTFSLAACNDQIDRDNERFTLRTLSDLTKIFPGMPVLRDHKWSADTQTARVYDASVEPMASVSGGSQLVLRCYMPRLESNREQIAAIEAGILKECSISLAVERVVCSICGTDQREAWCQHLPGKEYNGTMCHMELDGATDAYEVSLVAVPAQPEAGIIKSKRYGSPGEPQAPSEPSEEALRLAKAMQEQENVRFGGQNV